METQQDTEVNAEQQSVEDAKRSKKEDATCESNDVTVCSNFVSGVYLSKRCPANCLAALVTDLASVR